jgi:glycosyltransferase involved in cell wall biosynthesis
MVVEPADQGWAHLLTGDPVEAVTAHVLGLSGGLAARGHDVVVHIRRADGTQPDRVPTASGVVLSRLLAGPTHPLPDEDRLRVVPELSRRLADAWARERPDVVHAHGWQAGLATLAAVQLLPDRSTRPVVVQTFHGPTLGRRADGRAPDRSPSTASLSRRRLEAAIARGVDRLVALSADEVDRLLTLGATRLAVEVVPTGVDPATYPPARARADSGAPARLLVVSGLAVEERTDTAVRALRAVPAAELLVVGGPPAEGLAHHLDARRLQDVARRCRVPDRVRLLGAVPRRDLPALLRATDVLVSTDVHEPSGRYVLEAMASGVPVIGPAAGCVLDAVVEGATGTLVPPGDPGALAIALRELLSDPVRREGYGLAAAERARVRYGWDRVAEETERAYAGPLVRRSATAAAAPAEPAATGGAVPTGS